MRTVISIVLMVTFWTFPITIGMPGLYIIHLIVMLIALGK
jgi:hypothetical protein